MLLVRVDTQTDRAKLFRKLYKALCDAAPAVILINDQIEDPDRSMNISPDLYLGLDGGKMPDDLLAVESDPDRKVVRLRVWILKVMPLPEFGIAPARIRGINSAEKDEQSFAIFECELSCCQAFAHQSSTASTYPTLSPRLFLIGIGERSGIASASKIPSFLRIATATTGRPRISSPSAIFNAMPSPVGYFSNGTMPQAQTPSAPTFEMSEPLPARISVVSRRVEPPMSSGYSVIAATIRLHADCVISGKRPGF